MLSALPLATSPLCPPFTWAAATSDVLHRLSFTRPLLAAMTYDCKVAGRKLGADRAQKSASEKSTSWYRYMRRGTTKPLVFNQDLVPEREPAINGGVKPATKSMFSSSLRSPDKWQKPALPGLSLVQKALERDAASQKRKYGFGEPSPTSARFHVTTPRGPQSYKYSWFPEVETQTSAVVPATSTPTHVQPDPQSEWAQQAFEGMCASPELQENCGSSEFEDFWGRSTPSTRPPSTLRGESPISRGQTPSRPPSTLPPRTSQSSTLPGCTVRAETPMSCHEMPLPMSCHEMPPAPASCHDAPPMPMRAESRNSQVVHEDLKGVRFDMATLEGWFRGIDRHGTGAISEREFILALRQRHRHLLNVLLRTHAILKDDTEVEYPCGRHLTRQEIWKIKQILREVDSDDNGTMEWSEFVDFFRRAGLLLEYQTPTGEIHNRTGLCQEEEDRVRKEDEMLGARMGRMTCARHGAMSQDMHKLTLFRESLLHGTTSLPSRFSRMDTDPLAGIRSAIISRACSEEDM